jgi:hypothetical protein
MALINKVLTTANQTIFTSSPTSNQEGHAVTCMIICNTTVSDAVVSIYAVPASKSGTSDTTTQIVNALLIPAGETVSLDQEKIVLGSGDSITAQSDQNNRLTFTLSYIPV